MLKLSRVPTNAAGIAFKFRDSEGNTVLLCIMYGDNEAPGDLEGSRLLLCHDKDNGYAAFTRKAARELARAFMEFAEKGTLGNADD